MAYQMRDITGFESNKCNLNATVQCDHDTENPNDPFQYFVGIVNKGGVHYQIPVIFQHGPIKEAGNNGLTHEILLAIMIDRLEKFQEGKYQCIENQKALECLKDAVHWLNERTRKRTERGVEGTHEV